mmetsp:Transcript_14734/g.48080  ORF Transcript_14734/g.48080 Transcript_14734/m.48080 type:complete len:320 (-) Transcript_14734:714-1673(-)
MGASFEFAAELASSGFLEAGFLAHEQAGVGSDRPDVDPVADFLEGTPLLRRGEAVQLVRVFVVDEVHGVAVDGAFRRDDGLGLGRRRRGLFSFRGGVVLLESDDAVMQRADDPGISVAELFSSGGRVGPASVEAGLQVLVSSVRIGAAVDFEARRNQGVDDDVPMFVVDRTAETVRTTADLAAQVPSSLFFEAGQCIDCQSAGISHRPDADLRSRSENPALLLRRRAEKSVDAVVVDNEHLAAGEGPFDRHAELKRRRGMLRRGKIVVRVVVRVVVRIKLVVGIVVFQSKRRQTEDRPLHRLRQRDAALKDVDIGKGPP